MSVKQEIENSEEPEILRWLFERYHMESKWSFVAKHIFAQHGRQSYPAPRTWKPTPEGRVLYLSRNMELELREHIDKVISETPSTWREETEDRDRFKELHDKISNGKDLLITALESKIVDIELRLACCKNSRNILITSFEEQLKKQSYCIICGQTLNQEET